MKLHKKIFISALMLVVPFLSARAQQKTNVVFNAGHTYNLSISGQLSAQQCAFTSNSSSPSAGDWGSMV